jgi:hypothetical protein
VSVKVTVNYLCVEGNVRLEIIFMTWRLINTLIIIIINNGCKEFNGSVCNCFSELIEGVSVLQEKHSLCSRWQGF